MPARPVVNRCRFLLRTCILAAAAMVALAAVGPAAALATQGPVAAYSFDEGEGSTVEDLTGYGHTATIEGAKWTTHGRYGSAMEFDGEDDCVSLSSEPALDLSEEFTLEAWVRPEGEPGPDPVIVGESEGSVAYALGIGIPHEGKAEGVIGATAGAVHVHSAGTVDVDAWTHLAVTFDGAKLRLYKNGELVAEEAVSEPKLSGSEAITIGCSDHYGTHFKGRIDEVRIYDRALDGAEVSSDMETPIQTPRQGPVAAYSFDEGEGTTATDATGNGHTATIEGARWAHGRYGDGLEFDGKEGCVSIPVDEGLQATEEFTIEAWVRPEGSGEEALPVISMNDEGSPPGSEQFSYELFAGQDAAPKGWVRKAGEEGTWGVHGEEPLPERSWSHVALTDDGHELRLYVDGKLGREENSTDVAPPLTEAEGPLTIGCGIQYGSYRHFKGRIDEVRVYDRALDGAEVDADAETPIQTPKQGPVAAYSFDEGEGTTVEDVTGDGHTATIEGARWARGRYGDGLEFDGEEGCVSIPVDEELQATEEFTIEAWVRPEGSGGEPLPVISMNDEASPPGSEQFSYELFAGQDAAPKGWVRKAGEEGTWGVHGEEPLPEKTWSHLTLTDDGSKLRLYVDGKLGREENSTDVAPPLTEAEGPLTIGCGIQYGSYRHFKGRIDEVRVYDRALDAGEVVADAETPIQTPKHGPVAEYSFDEGKGETVEDISGDGHTATIHGAEWTTHGKYGGAMEFPAGQEGYLSVPDSPELDFTEEFTLEAWVRPDAGNSKYAPLIAKKTPGSSAEPYFLYEGSWEEDLPYGGLEGETEAETESHAKQTIPDNAWTHLALVFDGSKTRLYVDGELVDEAPGSLTTTSEGELLIGKNGDGDLFSGRIDELRIYNRALDGAEVSSDMETPIQTPRQGPVAAYSFDEGEGTTVEDLTGDDNEGTVEGAIWTTHGRYGDALEFNGESSCVSVPNSTSLQLGEEFTIEAWVKPKESSSDRPIVFKEAESALGYSYALGIGGSGKPQGFAEGEDITAPATIEANVWNHLTYTYDGNRMRLYLDGNLVASKEVGSKTMGSGGPLYIGCDGSFGPHFEGKIDEVRLYERALSEAEIADVQPPTFGWPFNASAVFPPGAEAPFLIFTEATDPPLPDGHAGTGLAYYTYRYSLNGGMPTGWIHTTASYIELSGAEPGMTVTIEVTAADRVGNISAPETATVAIPEVESSEPTSEEEEDRLEEEVATEQYESEESVSRRYEDTSSSPSSRGPKALAAPLPDQADECTKKFGYPHDSTHKPTRINAVAEVECLALIHR